ncbi:phospholipid-binding protein MlaC [Aeromonas cavernicola]|uniref:Phospholipid-binding protein MlaC n=1 Tax=Aeromonas cavernicola TaxID=1006623 RepID=A0A2H9U730_9GAMM|nr:phospholipid-binding protein MlaC [Aeromonas cavernicola]PJG59802.1 phospholipid-binding protein MlaC [Aeromonas cavernicola]
MFRKIVLLLGLITSMMVSLSLHAAVDAKDPNALVDMAAKQTFARLKADQKLIKSNPEHLRVIIREELLPYVDNRFAAYKVLGNQIKQTTPAQRDAFVAVFTEYMVSSYADALAHFDKQTVKVEPSKAPSDSNITAVNLSVKEAGKPDIFLEFKLRKNNKTGEWKAFDMVAEGISLLSAKQNELGGLIRQNGIDAVIKQLTEHNAKPLVLKS